MTAALPPQHGVVPQHANTATACTAIRLRTSVRPVLLTKKPVQQHPEQPFCSKGMSGERHGTSSRTYRHQEQQEQPGQLAGPPALVQHALPPDLVPAPPPHLSVRLSAYLPAYLSILLSVGLPVCLTLCLSVCLASPPAQQSAPAMHPTRHSMGTSTWPADLVQGLGFRV